jgi:hypothetical protein
VGGGPAGDGAWGRTPFTRSPLQPPPLEEVRSLSTPPWTTRREVLFKKSPKIVGERLIESYGKDSCQKQILAILHAAREPQLQLFFRCRVEKSATYIAAEVVCKGG